MRTPARRARAGARARPARMDAGARAGRTRRAAADPAIGCGAGHLLAAGRRRLALQARADGACTAGAAARGRARTPRATSRCALPRASGIAETPQALVAETLAVLDDPQFAAAFAPGSQAEAGLLADLPRTGRRRAHQWPHRPAGGDAGRSPDPGLQDQPPAAGHAKRTCRRSILRQMALYRAGAARVFPGRRIVCGLVFTDGPRLLRLSDAVLDAQLAGIAARLDPQGGRS